MDTETAPHRSRRRLDSRLVAIFAGLVGLAVAAGCSSSTTGAAAPAAAEPEDATPTGVTDPGDREDAAPLQDGGAEDAATDAAKKRKDIEGPVNSPKSCDDLCKGIAMACVGSVDAAYERPSTGGIRHRTFDCATAPPATINLPSIAEDGVLAYYTCTCEEP